MRARQVTIGRSAARKGIAVLAVVMAHALLVLLWRPAPARREPETRLAIRLIPSRAEHEPSTSTSTSTSTSKASTDVMSPATSPEREAAPERRSRSDRSRPAPVFESIGPPATSIDPMPARPAEPESRHDALDALDLRVRPEPQRAPSASALTDPRSNTARPTAADHMAQRLGSDDRRYEEVRLDGSVRIRQGASCIDARVARAAELDAFNAAVHAAPRQISACE